MSFLELSFFHVFLTIFNCLNIWQLFFFPKRSGKLLILFPLASFLTYRLNYLFFRLYTYSFLPILIVCIFRSFFVPFLSHDYSRSSSGLVMLPSLMESSITDGEMLLGKLDKLSNRQTTFLHQLLMIPSKMVTSPIRLSYENNHGIKKERKMHTIKIGRKE